MDVDGDLWPYRYYDLKIEPWRLNLVIMLNDDAAGACMHCAGKRPLDRVGRTCGRFCNGRLVNPLFLSSHPAAEILLLSVISLVLSPDRIR